MLVFDPQTGERRLRMIEEEEEFRRVQRLHPGADELLLRPIRGELEDRFQSASANGAKGHVGDWQKLLAKWNETRGRRGIRGQRNIRRAELGSYSKHQQRGIVLPAAPAKLAYHGNNFRLQFIGGQRAVVFE